MLSSKFLPGLVSVLAWLTLRTVGLAQELPSGLHRIEHAAIRGATIYRGERRLYVVPVELTEGGSMIIPRMFSSIRSIGWSNSEKTVPIELQPEPETWLIRWKERPAEASWLWIEFDDEPIALTELQPSRASGDGSLFMPASKAITTGEKLRFEPQSHKNTVGYWTTASDTASWRLNIDRAGEFNIEILQGCGAGQGGSRGSIKLMNDQAEIASIEFDVLETGHFQNFQWRHLGQLKVAEPGVYTLIISPITIKKAALMDVRAVHLVRLP